MAACSLDRASQLFARARSRVSAHVTRTRRGSRRHVTAALALAAALCTDPSTVAGPHVLGNSAALFKLACQAVTFWGLVSLTLRWRSVTARATGLCSLLAVALRWHFLVNENAAHHDDALELLALGWQLAAAVFLWTRSDSATHHASPSEDGDALDVQAAADESEPQRIVEAA